MEALVKGLTQEALDLKSVAMKMSKQTEERSRQDAQTGATGCSGCTAAGCYTGRCSRRFKHGGHAKGARPSRYPCSTTGTRDGYDHADRRNHETGTTPRR